MFMFMKRDIFLFTVIVLEKIISRLKNSNFKIEHGTSMAKFFSKFRMIDDISTEYYEYPMSAFFCVWVSLLTVCNIS